MDKNTFGASDRYKVLVELTEKISQLDKNRRGYLSLFIGRFNNLVWRIACLRDDYFRDHIIYATKKDYDARLEAMREKYGDEIVSYLRNFIHAKFKNIDTDFELLFKIKR